MGMRTFLSILSANDLLHLFPDAACTLWRYKQQLKGKAKSYGVRYPPLEDPRNAPRM
jgi:hypothetical protein